jgi:hypothetical protein
MYGPYGLALPVLLRLARVSQWLCSCWGRPCNGVLAVLEISQVLPGWASPRSRFALRKDCVGLIVYVRVERSCYNKLQKYYGRALQQEGTEEVCSALTSESKLLFCPLTPLPILSLYQPP